MRKESVYVTASDKNNPYRLNNERTLFEAMHHPCIHASRPLVSLEYTQIETRYDFRFSASPLAIIYWYWINACTMKRFHFHFVDRYACSLDFGENRLTISGNARAVWWNVHKTINQMFATTTKTEHTRAPNRTCANAATVSRAFPICNFIDEPEELLFCRWYRQLYFIAESNAKVMKGRSKSFTTWAKCMRLVYVSADFSIALDFHEIVYKKRMRDLFFFPFISLN